jgi:hypothetical protein
MRMKRLVSMGLLMVVAAMPAGASTFLKMTQKDLVRDAAVVVKGQVIQVNSFWNAEGTAIVSEAMVKVDEALLGRPDSVVIVKTFGGEVNGYYVEAHGFPKFTLNEKVLLFLEAEHDGAARVAGYQQGQFRVIQDKAGVEYAIPALDLDANVLAKDGRPAPRETAIRLDVLRNSIRTEAVRAGRALEN